MASKGAYWFTSFTIFLSLEKFAERLTKNAKNINVQLCSDKFLTKVLMYIPIVKTQPISIVCRSWEGHHASEICSHCFRVVFFFLRLLSVFVKSPAATWENAGRKMAFLTTSAEYLTGWHSNWSLVPEFDCGYFDCQLSDFPGEYACSTDQPFADADF